MKRPPLIFRNLGFENAKIRLRNLMGARNRIQAPEPPDLRPVSGLMPWTGPIVLADAGVEVTFQRESERLRLVQIASPGTHPLVQAGVTGNPLSVVVQQGRYAGVHGMGTFHVNKLFTGDRRLLAFVEHDDMPMQISLDISVEGNVITWLGQALWNGEEQLDADIYFPLLSRLTFDNLETGRAVFPHISGSTRGPLEKINYSCAYLGSLSSPVFIVEGSGRGLAVLDDNRADLAVDAGAAARRVYLVGNRFPLPDDQSPGGADGPFVGICHTRLFRPISVFGGDAQYNAAEAQNPQYMRKLGDSVDLGPVRSYAYTGTWKAGAHWLRARRSHVPMRISPAEWYQQTRFISEGDVEQLARSGRTLLDLPKLLVNGRAGGADLLNIRGFHDGELLGVEANMQNRGDYEFPAQNLGGPDALRGGIAATHRAGGHVLLYVEGLIVWKRGRIGRSNAEQWELLNADGSPAAEYRGFWHACPAASGYQEWLAKTLAEIIRTTCADGFFIDSSLATNNHRCFNPAHHHPHPDVWNWGVRQMLRRVREEVDKVNPDTILLVEGCGDLGREFVDGFLSHTHAWTEETFTEPLVRFLHPEMRAFESWGASGAKTAMPLEKLRKYQVWNAVHGHRIYAHAPSFDSLAPLSLRTRHYYNAFPEITDDEISLLDVTCHDCIAQLYEGTVPVLTVGNVTGGDAHAEITLPIQGAILFDRVDGTRVRIRARNAQFRLQPHEFRAFEVRP